MKRRLVSILILIFLLCLTLCGCDTSKVSPWGRQFLKNNTPKTYKIYICGAVENEGYYEIGEGEEYFVALNKAGLHPYAMLPTNALSLANGKLDAFNIGYYEDGVARSCVNVNGTRIIYRMSTEGLTDEVVNKLADYIEAYGTITNATTLRAALGDDYADYHYKLYIAEADYEEVD